MTHACPECGTPVNERAAVCPRCGFPLRRDGFHAPPGTPHGGWEEPGDSAAYELLVITAERGNLCIEADPRTAGRVLSVRGDGVVLHAGCGEQTTSAGSAHPSDDALREESRLLLQESWGTLAPYHEAHGHYFRTAEEAREAITRRRNALAYFWLTLVPYPDGRICIGAMPHPGTTAVFMSVDEHGDLYPGPNCEGQPLEHFADEGLDAVPDSILKR